MSNSQFFTEWRELKASLSLLHGYFNERMNLAVVLGPDWEIKKEAFNSCLIKINELIPILVSEKPDPILLGQDIKDSLDLVTIIVKMIENIEHQRKA